MEIELRENAGVDVDSLPPMVVFNSQPRAVQRVDARQPLERQRVAERQALAFQNGPSACILRLGPYKADLEPAEPSYKVPTRIPIFSSRLSQCLGNFSLLHSPIAPIPANFRRRFLRREQTREREFADLARMR